MTDNDDDTNPRGRADYAERVEARRDRLETAADKASAEAQARDAAFRRISDGIPMGQPILVGHHSEKRHRRDIEKMQNNIRKSVEAQKRSTELERRAESVGTGGISADDPEAIRKLKAELEEAEAHRDAMKRANAAWRKAKTDKDRASVLDSLSAEMRASAVRHFKFWPGGASVPFPSLTNTSANIRRITKRIEELSKAPPTFETIDGKVAPKLLDVPHVKTCDWVGCGGCAHATFEIEARPDLNRIALKVSARLTRDAFKAIKSDGWRWSPTEEAFLTGLHNGGIYNARRAAEKLRGET